MRFLRNLPKQFVNSMVRQVGRDSGKVISNKMYKGKHGTPVYRTDNPYSSKSNHSTTNSYSAKSKYQQKPIEISQIDMSVQPKIKDGGVDAVLKGILIQIIPLIGTIAVLFRGISYLITNTTPIYMEIPNKIPDRRYKEGYRIEGSSLVKTDQKRYLSDHERRGVKSRGISYLLSLILFFLIALAIRYLL